MRAHRLLGPAMLLSISVLLPSTALAGGCTECSTNAECEAIFGAPAFCVMFDGPTGCGATRQYCCPGQGCAIVGGRPSCETAGTCTVVGGGTDAGPMPVDGGGGPPLPDAGPTDAGSTDAGSTDAGSSPVDSGTAPADGGTTPMDGGTTPSMSGGCGCRVAPTRSGAAIAPAILLIALLRRRR
ncbi:MAG: hypothetical protein IT378_00015 [Sandaracinaceae bacterium]|nr:hypothetical protein [Sandaracinaceae bacterium]